MAKSLAHQSPSSLFQQGIRKTLRIFLGGAWKVLIVVSWVVDFLYSVLKEKFYLHFQDSKLLLLGFSGEDLTL